MPTLTVAFVHMLFVLVLCHQNGAAIGRSLQINEATRTGEIKQIFNDRKDQDNNAVGWLENRGKVDSDSRTKRARTGDSGYGSRLDAGNNIASGNLQKHLFDDLGKRAAVIDSGYRSRLDTAQIIAAGNLKSVLFADLGKRAAVGDSGYGSRLDAVQNIANYYLQRFLFDSLGKRAVVFTDSYMPFEQRFLSEFADLGDLVKRAAVIDNGYGSHLDAGQNMALRYYQGIPFSDLGGRAVTGDSGYSSRLDAGHNIANDYLQQSLFDSLGKRAVVFTDTYMPFEQRFLPENGYGSSVTKGMVKRVHGDDTIFERYSQKSGTKMETDSGYGSRVFAGSQLAYDFATLSDIFGKHGPGNECTQAEIDTNHSKTRVNIILEDFNIG